MYTVLMCSCSTLNKQEAEGEAGAEVARDRGGRGDR